MRSSRDEVVVVTGAGSGIGRATAVLYAGMGSDVVAVDIRSDRLAELNGEIRKRGGEIMTCTLDVADRKSMEAFAKTVLFEKGRVDVLVNNAGIAVVGEIKDMNLHDWERVLGVNYWGAVFGIHAFLPSMIERRSGHIVNVASANGLFSMPFEGIYSSTKFALVGLSESLRCELDRFGIGVTVVCPGMTDTAILQDARMIHGSERSRIFLEKFQRLLKAKGADPDVLAEAVVRGVTRNRAVVRAPFHVVFIDWVHRFFPWLYRWLLTQVCRRHA